MRKIFSNFECFSKRPNFKVRISLYCCLRLLWLLQKMTNTFVLPLRLKQNFPPIIWICTEGIVVNFNIKIFQYTLEGEGDGIKSRLPFNIFSTLLSFWIRFLLRQWNLFLHKWKMHFHEGFLPNLLSEVHALSTWAIVSQITSKL